MLPKGRTSAWSMLALAFIVKIPTRKLKCLIEVLAVCVGFHIDHFCIGLDEDVAGNDNVLSCLVAAMRIRFVCCTIRSYGLFFVFQ